jgi:glycine cleavage system H lipoate-binding protein
MEPLYKCVWMAAGVLSYRLCDREFDCDRCLVDRALREGGSPLLKDAAMDLAPSASTATAPTVSGLRFSRAGFYHASHLWSRVEGGGTVRIGIDDLARRLLGRVREIRVPQLGTTPRSGQKALSFSGDAGDVDLPMPIGGTIVSRNEELLADPGRLQATPHQEVWLVRTRPSRLQDDLNGLLYGRRVASWLRAEMERVRSRLLAAHAVEVGTLPDGGTLDPAILDRIDSKIRRLLVEDLLLGPTQDQKGR